MTWYRGPFVQGFSRALLSVVLCFVVFEVAPAKGRVETVQFQSKLVKAKLPYNVILPVDYDSLTTTPLSSTLSLAWLNGDHTDWLARTNVADYATDYRLIIVMPEGNDS